MIKNIKTKETIKDIKTLDKKKMLDSFNKKQSINTKNNVQLAKGISSLLSRSINDAKNSLVKICSTK